MNRLINKGLLLYTLIFTLLILLSGCSQFAKKKVDNAAIQAYIDSYIENGTYDTMTVTTRDSSLENAEEIIFEAQKEHLYATETIKFSETWHYDEYSHNFFPSDAPIEMERTISLESPIIGAVWTNLARYYGTMDVFADTFNFEVETVSDDGITLKVTKKDTWTAYWERLDAAPEATVRITCPDLTYFRETEEWGVSLRALDSVLYDSEAFDNFDDNDYFIFDLDQPQNGKIQSVYGNSPQVIVKISCSEEGTRSDEDKGTDVNETSFSSSITRNLYIGSAISDGFSGEVKVTITVDGSQNIIDVEVEEHDTPNIGSKAANALKNELIGATSIMVDDDSGFTTIVADAVTGATVTSKALIAAAKEAYIIAIAKSAGMVSYDALNPICGIWKWDSSDCDLANSIWCLFPDGVLRSFKVYDDEEWEYAYKYFYESFTSVTDYSYIEGNIILRNRDANYSEDIGAINWLDSNNFSLITEYDDYFYATRILFE